MQSLNEFSPVVLKEMSKCEKFTDQKTDGLTQQQVKAQVWLNLHPLSIVYIHLLYSFI